MKYHEKIPDAYGVHNFVPAADSGGGCHLGDPCRGLPARWGGGGPGGRNLSERGKAAPGTGGSDSGLLPGVLRCGGRGAVHFDGRRLPGGCDEDRSHRCGGQQRHPIAGRKGDPADSGIDDPVQFGGDLLRHVGGDHGLLPSSDPRVRLGGLRSAGRHRRGAAGQRGGRTGKHCEPLRHGHCLRLRRGEPGGRPRGAAGNAGPL